MNRSASVVRVGFVVGVVVSVVVSASCRLTPYPSGAITCSADGNDDRACPDGYQCLDPKQTGQTTCLEVGCGDGQTNPALDEECDDANDNDFDLCARCQSFVWRPGADNAVIGLGAGDGAAGTDFGRPNRVDVDRDGNVFVAALGSFRIWRLAHDATSGGAALADGTKVLTPFAGSGSLFEVSRGARTRPNDISTTLVAAVELDNLGNAFVADLDSKTVRRIDGLTGDVTVAAGVPAAGGTDDGSFVRAEIEDGPASLAVFTQPAGIAVDGDGNLYVADGKFAGKPEEPSGAILRVDVATGDISTFIGDRRGNTPVPGDFDPIDVDIDEAGEVFVLDNRPDTAVRVFGADGSLRQTFPLKGSPCGVDLQDETRDRTMRIAAAPDGSKVYFVFIRNVWELDVSDGSCFRLTDEVDRGPLGEPIPLDLLDLALLVDRDGGSATVRSVVVADPQRGVVVEIPAGGGATRDIAGVVDEYEGNGIAGAGVGVGVDNLQELVVDVARQTDGRVTVNATVGCHPLEPGLELKDLDLKRRDSWELLGTSPDLNKVIRIGCNDSIREIAGTGVAGFSGDSDLGGEGEGEGEGAPAPLLPAVEAQLNRPAAAVSDVAGNIYIADRDNHRVRRVRRVRGVDVIETFIGTGVPGDNGLNNPLDGIQLNAPFGLSFIDAELRTLLVADSRNNRILAVDTVDGTARVFVGSDADAAVQEDIVEPTALVVLAGGFVKPEFQNAGYLLFTERGRHRVSQTLVLNGRPGAVTPLAGGDSPGDVDGAGGIDGPARFRSPRSLMLGGFAETDALPTLTLLVVDAVDRLRSIALTFDPVSFALSAAVQTLKDDGTAVTDERGGGFSSVDGDARVARFNAPSSMVMLDARHILVSDKLTGILREVSVGDDATSTTVTAVAGLPEGAEINGAPLPALLARPLRAPTSMALMATTSPPTLFVAEGGSDDCASASDEDNGVVVAGDDVSGNVHGVRRFFLHDPADPQTWTTDVLNVCVASPAGLVVDERDPAQPSLFIADDAEHVVVRVSLSDAGAVAAVDFAGSRGQRGFAGDGAPAESALLNGPSGLGLSPTTPRQLYIADTGNQRVRRVVVVDNPALRSITTVLGNGALSSGGEGAPASSFSVQSPAGLDVDARGNLLVTSVDTLRFLQADDDGLAGKASADLADLRADLDPVATFYGADRSAFPESVTRCLTDVKFVPSETPGSVYALDACLGLLVRLDRSKP